MAVTVGANVPNDVSIWACAGVLAIEMPNKVAIAPKIAEFLSVFNIIDLIPRVMCLLEQELAQHLRVGHGFLPIPRGHL
ncbi:MAG: hypothetical protein ING44_01985 [Telmatospirillum sp.]|nr:hypothetical protein [Telmatospirillum sp.]